MQTSLPKYLQLKEKGKGKINKCTDSKLGSERIPMRSEQEAIPPRKNKANWYGNIVAQLMRTQIKSGYRQNGRKKDSVSSHTNQDHQKGKQNTGLASDPKNNKISQNQHLRHDQRYLQKNGRWLKPIISEKGNQQASTNKDKASLCFEKSSKNNFHQKKSLQKDDSLTSNRSHDKDNIKTHMINKNYIKLKIKKYAQAIKQSKHKNVNTKWKLPQETLLANILKKRGRRSKQELASIERLLKIIQKKNIKRENESSASAIQAKQQIVSRLSNLRSPLVQFVETNSMKKQLINQPFQLKTLSINQTLVQEPKEKNQIFQVKKQQPQNRESQIIKENSQFNLRTVNMNQLEKFMKQKITIDKAKKLHLQSKTILQSIIVVSTINDQEKRVLSEWHKFWKEGRTKATYFQSKWEEDKPSFEQRRKRPKKYKMKRYRKGIADSSEDIADSKEGIADSSESDHSEKESRETCDKRIIRKIKRENDSFFQMSPELEKKLMAKYQADNQRSDKSLTISSMSTE